MRKIDIDFHFQLVYNLNMPKTNTSKKTGITLRERKLIKGIISGKTKQQAALDAGFGSNLASSAQLAYQTLKKPSTREALLEAMEKAGIGDNALAQAMREGLKAKKAIAMRDDKPVMVDDHLSRAKFVDIAVKIRGDYASEKVEHSGQVDIRSVNINFVDSLPESNGDGK